MPGRGGEGAARLSLEGTGLDPRDSHLEGLGDIRTGALTSLECGWPARGRPRRQQGPAPGPCRASVSSWATWGATPAAGRLRREAGPLSRAHFTGEKTEAQRSRSRSVVPVPAPGGCRHPATPSCPRNPAHSSGFCCWSPLPTRDPLGYPATPRSPSTARAPPVPGEVGRAQRRDARPDPEAERGGRPGPPARGAGTGRPTQDGSLAEQRPDPRRRRDRQAARGGGRQTRPLSGPG